MKKNIFLRFGSLLLSLIVVTGCQKQIQQQDKKAGDVLAKIGNNANVEKRCRLLVDEGLSDGFNQSYHYSDKGLADEFYLSKPGEYNFWATMSYGDRNEIRNARFFYDAATFYDIVFEYDKDKITTETWYVPGTDISVDGYINSYNGQGQLVKRDEPLYELYTLYYYDAARNPVKIELFDYAGNLWYGANLDYSRPIKNPFMSVTGLPESIWFTDAIEGPNRFTGLRYYFLDQGSEFTFFQWKSEETEIITGAENYPVYQKSIDAIGGMETAQTWTYENCAGNSDAAHSKQGVSPSKGNPFVELLHAKKSGHYKQDILNFRKSFLVKKN
jgi:hypothetical protein